jgi:hypothetical protein
VAFGQLTGPPGAAAATVAVSATALTETAVGILLSTKAKLAAAACIGLFLLLGGLLSWPEPASRPAPARPGVRSIHFTEQSPVAESADIDFGVRSRGAYEQWYHFPQAGREAFLFRMQRWNPRQTRKLCWWVQNEDANYYVYSEDNTVYVQNARLYHSDLRVKRLPTDPESMWRFIHEIEAPLKPGPSTAEELTYERDPDTGYLRSRVDHRYPQLGPFRTQYEYSNAEPEPELFTSPQGAKLVDERDAMHRRGWTYYRVAGAMGRRTVSGQGRVPFTYRASLEHPAWLRLEVTDGPAVCDGGPAAFVTDSAGAVVAVYEPGALLAGLPRPWTGFHTLDVIRRDAARRQIWFSTEVIEQDRLAEVVLLDPSDADHRMARYLVDLPNDLLREAHFWSNPDGVFGEPSVSLRFEYLDEVAGLDDEFIQPAPPGSAQGRVAGPPGPLWPLLLCKEPPAPPTVAGRQR